MTAVTDKDIRNLTGRELLSYIQKEKIQLENSRDFKKQKPSPPIPDEIKPFQLPDDWTWARLGDISKKIHYGYTASATDKDTGVKMLRITDIQDNKVDWSHVPYCEIDSGKLEATRLYPRDILFARTGATVGKSFLVEQIEGVSVFASYLIRVQLMEPMNAEFIKFFFESPLYWKQIINAVTGTGQPNVNATSLSQLMVPIPPLTAQAEIVTKFQNGTMLTENIKGKVAREKKELERYRQAILKEAMRGELVEQNLEEGSGQELMASIQLKQQKKQTLSPVEEKEKIYEVPNNWTWVRLGEIGETSTGKTPSKKEFSTNYSKELFPFVRSNHMNKGEIRGVEEFVTSSRTVPPNSVMMVCIGDIGRACITKEESAFNQQINAISNIKVETKFIYYQLISEYFISEATRRSGQTTIKIINKTKWENIPIVLPPLTEQKRIAEKLDAIMAVCDRLEEELETTKAEAEKWYRAILQEAFQPNVESE